MGARWVVVLACQSNGALAWVHVVFLVSTLLCFVAEVHAVAVCEPEVARVVSVEGTVELRRASQTNWQTVVYNTLLCAGDMLRVRARSRADLRLSNESMLRLDQKTTITFPERAADKATSLLDLIKGALHIITRTPKPFKVRTPFLNGAVDGTEFSIRINPDSTTIVLYEGQVSASNQHGALVLAGYEAAIADRNQAPRKITIVKPTDAVQWALYYPTILDHTLVQQGTASIAPELLTSIELAQHGKLSEALSALDTVPQSAYSADFFTHHAGLLLSVGRVDEANLSISQALNLEPNNSDAHSLQSIIAVVQNDKAQALNFASRAVNLNPTSPAAKLALSYAQQAHFEIEKALMSVQEAVQINKQNALAWARLAELHMSMGELDHAMNSAQKAVRLNPHLAKTKTVLGFAHLLKIDTEMAKSIFTQAIALDQADPMPRLGMGLALIREGKLDAGRVELEIAASLDPANSLIRSYLGKAYFEEKRYDLASTQFDLAKKRDPRDPTPWFYDAVQKQTQNRPVEALQDIQKSIELNDNRAVYRSKLLLDQDQAGRGSSLARVYDNLGFERRALMETAKSLSFDPANHSAHRFLSDAYANVPRHEIARVSELLQAQLLQPINVNPVQPRLAVADLNIITNTGPAVAGFNEFAPLMERNKPQLVASGIVGSHSTFGNEVVASALYDRASISLGQFHYETNGFRKNNGQNHDVYNAFMQYAVTSKFNVQAEVRRRETKHGDLLLDFDTKNHTEDRRNLDQDTVRVGARYALTPQQDLIVSAIYADRKENQTIAVPAITVDIPVPPFQILQPGFNLNSIAKDKGYQVEGQYLLRDEYFNVTAGGGFYQIDVKDLQVCNGGQCPSTAIKFKRERENAYIYSNLSYFENINVTFGLSYDAFKDVVDFKFDAFNPKFGLQWNITDTLRLRLAWFETVKSALITNQTLEPTQVAGFNQLFDDPNGTKARRMGLGLDTYFLKSLYGGVEISDRDLKVPLFEEALTLLAKEQQQERLYRAYLYWLPHPYWSINGEFKFERYTRHAEVVGGDKDKPFQIGTLSAPLVINYFHPKGLFAKFTTTYIRQHLKRVAESTAREGTDDFVLFDVAVGYRLPNRRGFVSFEGRNLSNAHFLYRNVNFQLNEAITPRFTPTRTFFGRVTLNF